MKKGVLGGILVSIIIFLYLFILPDYLNDRRAENFQTDLKDALVTGHPLPQMWVEYLEQAQTICFVSYYMGAQDVNNIVPLSTDTKATLENKLSIPYGFSDTTWWILGISDRQIQYMLRMSRLSIGPSVGGVICGDSKDLILQTVPNQPHLFYAAFG